MNTKWHDEGRLSNAWARSTWPRPSAPFGPNSAFPRILRPFCSTSLVSRRLDAVAYVLMAACAAQPHSRASFTHTYVRMFSAAVKMITYVRTYVFQSCLLRAPFCSFASSTHMCSAAVQMSTYVRTYVRKRLVPHGYVSESSDEFTQACAGSSFPSRASGGSPTGVNCVEASLGQRGGRDTREHSATYGAGLGPLGR